MLGVSIQGEFTPKGFCIEALTNDESKTSKGKRFQNYSGFDFRDGKIPAQDRIARMASAY